MLINHQNLQVYETGRLTVVGFGGRDVLEDVNLVEVRDEISALVQEFGCEVLAFDLTGVTYMPSGLLGLLASLRQLGVEVHLYNPSAEIREVLHVTNLDLLMNVHEIAL